MKYLIFSGYSKGYAHTKLGMNCEDFATYYVDPDDHFAIATICDGHSASLCFRSAKGAELGCETAVEILKVFFKNVLSENLDESYMRYIQKNKANILDRVKRSILQMWNAKVNADIEKNPFTESELNQVKSDERQYCTMKEYRNHTYGSTFLAIGVCSFFSIILHIGDGSILFFDNNANIFFPLSNDPKSEYSGAPSSLPDSDLLSSEGAFRADIIPEIPNAFFATSDGIGDMSKNNLQIVLHSFMEEMKKISLPNKEIGKSDVFSTIDQQQQEYLNSMLEYYADRNNGSEDDCSLAGGFMWDTGLTNEIGDIDGNTVSSEMSDSKQDNLSQYKHEEEIQRLKSKLSEGEIKKQELIAQITSIDEEATAIQNKIEKEESALNSLESKQNEKKENKTSIVKKFCDSCGEKVPVLLAKKNISKNNRSN